MQTLDYTTYQRALDLIEMLANTGPQTSRDYLRRVVEGYDYALARMTRNPNQEFVILRAKDYKALVTAASQLSLLRDHGVDNWDGYGDALAEYWASNDDN